MRVLIVEDEVFMAEAIPVGLGLTIVKSITQAHDGILTLTPRAAGGSASRYSCPLRHSTPADDDRGRLT